MVGFQLKLAATINLAVFQLIKQSKKKSTKIRLFGGIKRFSTNKSAVAKRCFTADFRAACVRQLRYIDNFQRIGVRHPDLTQLRIKKDTQDVQSLFHRLTNTWQNQRCKTLQLIDRSRSKWRRSQWYFKSKRDPIGLLQKEVSSSLTHYLGSNWNLSTRTLKRKVL